MKYALKELPEGKGFILCDAATGKAIPGQVHVEIQCEPDIAVIDVTLRLHNLPLFKGES